VMQTWKAQLHEALFESSLEGIRKTGEATVYPLGAYLLVGAMIDMLAGLRFAPDNDRDGQQGKRYEAFVHEFFPERYAALGLGPKMWSGLRCRPLHNFAADELLLADSQPGQGLHLHPVPDGRQRICLHWPEFLADYEQALTNYWNRLEADVEIAANAKARCERYPPLMVTTFPRAA
jgi:hypothetical protein